MLPSEMQPRRGHLKHSFTIDEGGPKEFFCLPMKRLYTLLLFNPTTPTLIEWKGKKRFPKPLAHKHLWHPAFFLPVWMNRAKAGAEAAATATHETMQGNSDMGAAGTRRCGDDYTRAVPVGSRRITECLGLQWQRDDASAASALQELGFWVRGTEPFKVRQVKKKTKHWKEAFGKRRVIKRRYLSLVLTAFSRPDLSRHTSR